MYKIEYFILNNITNIFLILIIFLHHYVFVNVENNFNSIIITDINYSKYSSYLLALKLCRKINIIFSKSKNYFFLIAVCTVNSIDLPKNSGYCNN